MSGSESSSDPGRGELDRERDAVESPADSGDRLGVGGVEAEPRLLLRGPLREESYRLRRRDRFELLLVLVGQAERWHAVRLFGSDLERLTARGENLHARDTTATMSRRPSPRSR